MKFTGKVKYNGNHYFEDEIVCGTIIKIEDGKLLLFDNEKNYITGLGDFTREEWVEIKLETLEVKE